MTGRLGFHLLLALAWCLLSGSFGAWNFLGGLLIGLVVITVSSREAGRLNYALRLLGYFRFGAWFLVVLVRSNIQIAWEILTPDWQQTPRILRYSVAGLTDVQKTVLSSAITLTPGTLAVDLSDDGEWLYLHCMYAEDREEQIAEIDTLRRKLERWVFAR